MSVMPKNVVKELDILFEKNPEYATTGIEKLHEIGREKMRYTSSAFNKIAETLNPPIDQQTLCDIHDLIDEFREGILLMILHESMTDYKYKKEK